MMAVASSSIQNYKTLTLVASIVAVATFVLQGAAITRKPLLASNYTKTNEILSQTTNDPKKAQRSDIDVSNLTILSTANDTKTDAVEAYRERVRQSAKLRRHCQSHSDVREPLTSVAEACLNQSTHWWSRNDEGLPLTYPEDAEDHFNEIRLAMAPFAQHHAHKMHTAVGFEGPWIENEWITHFETLFDTRNEACLFDYFGPFIPLFIPWVDHWVQNRYRYPAGLVETLLSVLRPNVPYVTISQSDDGLEGAYEVNMSTIPNVLVLSAGGFGHVPIPLLKKVENLFPDDDPSQRAYGVSYVGSLTNAPNNMRAMMHLILTEWNKTHGEYHGYKGSKWRDVMRETRFNLVPRGFGRSSYHLMETVQMGRIPIHVYSDIPWVPYRNLFEEIGYATPLYGLAPLLNKLQNISKEEITNREHKIAALRESHFLAPGILSQVQRFLRGEKSDLLCEGLPASRRDAENKL